MKGGQFHFSVLTEAHHINLIALKNILFAISSCFSSQFKFFKHNNLAFFPCFLFFASLMMLLISIEMGRGKVENKKVLIEKENRIW